MEPVSTAAAAYKLYKIYKGIQDVNGENVKKYPKNIDKRKQADIMGSIGVIGNELTKV